MHGQGTAIFRLKEHTNRLFDSAHIMNMKIPFTKDEINEAQRAAVRENNLPSAYLRPMVFFGSEGMGLRASNLKVHVIVAAWDWGAYMGRKRWSAASRCAPLATPVTTSTFP
jgi:branched-chain amino acid aminotransferase